MLLIDNAGNYFIKFIYYTKFCEICKYLRLKMASYMQKNMSIIHLYTNFNHYESNLDGL